MALATNERVTVRGESYRMVTREPSGQFGRYWIVLQRVSDMTLWLYLAKSRNAERVPHNARLIERRTAS